MTTDWTYLVVDVDVQGERSVIVACIHEKVAEEIASRLPNGHVERVVLIGSDIDE